MTTFVILIIALVAIGKLNPPEEASKASVRAKKPTANTYAKGQTWTGEDGHTYFNDWTRGVVRIK